MGAGLLRTLVVVATALALSQSAAAAPPPNCPRLKIQCSDRFSSQTCGHIQEAVPKAFEEVFAHPQPMRSVVGCDLFPGVKQLDVTASPEGLELGAPMTPAVLAAFRLPGISFHFQEGWRNTTTGPSPIRDYSMLAVELKNALGRLRLLMWSNAPGPKLTLRSGRRAVALGAADETDWTQLVLWAKAGSREALSTDDSFEEVFRDAVGDRPAGKQGSR
jgi:hypothetical protein